MLARYHKRRQNQALSVLTYPRFFTVCEELNEFICLELGLVGGEFMETKQWLNIVCPVRSVTK